MAERDILLDDVLTILERMDERQKRIEETQERIEALLRAQLEESREDRKLRGRMLAVMSIAAGNGPHDD